MAALLLVLTAVAQPTAAGALSRGRGTGSASVGSASWAAIPTQSATPAAGSLRLTFTLAALTPPGPQYFDVVNTGTRTLSGTGYFVAVSGFALLGLPAVTLSACPVGVSWNPAGSGSCASGSPTAIGTFDSNSTLFVDSTAAPTAATTRLHIRAAVSNTGLLSGPLTAVVSAQVSSGSTRDFVAITNNH